MNGSRSNASRPATRSPATSRSAATISPTEIVIPGNASARLMPNAPGGSAAAWRKLATTRRGESSHTPVSSATGQVYGRPSSGSRMIALAKEEAAAFALPGRTTTVGRRSARPSTNPLRL